MKLNERSKGFVHIICLLCIFLFVYAAVSKLLDFNTFENQLGQSPVLSSYAQWVVWLVPALEIFVALAISLPRFKKWGLYGFFTIMVMFTAYIFIILNFADFVPCACGGILEKLGWQEHLLFNIGFIVLSLIAILLLSDTRTQMLVKTTGKLLGLVFVGITAVSLLYLGSEKQMKRNNAFTRRFIPHPIEKVGKYDLKYNSFYIAGMDEQKIYLGNYTTPLSMDILDIPSGQIKKHQIGIDSMNLPYKRIKIIVKPPYFFIGDGTVPVLLKGNIADWQASIFSFEDAYFTDFVSIDSSKIGFVTTSSDTGSKAIGFLVHKPDTNEIFLNTSILKKQMHERFDTDGMLLWNSRYKQFIYTYYYRNAFQVGSEQLEAIYTGNTIDTITQAVLNIAYYKKTDQYKKGGNSIMVNRKSTTDGHFLYINSDRLGKYEDEEALISSSIIDVYDIRDNSYAFSFYIYHQPGKKLRQFKIYKNYLTALVGGTLWIYQLKPKYFDISTSEKYTAQYQEEGRTPVKIVGH